MAQQSRRTRCSGECVRRPGMRWAVAPCCGSISQKPGIRIPAEQSCYNPRAKVNFRNLAVGVDMQIFRVLLWSFFLCLFGCVAMVSAQLPAVKTDPLQPAQMIQGAGACSA